MRDPSSLGDRVTFRTFAITLASDGSSGTGLVWAGQPGGSSSDYIAGGGVVRFRPAPASKAGLHALVHVGSGRFALPPMSHVRVVSVDPPGTWTYPWLQDTNMPRSGSLFTVEVTWV